MSDVVIRAENLAKRYLVGHQARSRERYTSLRDTLARGARTFARKTADFVTGRQIVEGDELEEFWALKDVNFEVRRGEVLGIIGRNGAGKSTLLKILSRITEPSAGRVTIKGRVASLLEVGTGFHPELTGRENIYLNGAILGMTRAEVRRKFDEIVDFAGVEQFLDTPVKRYSSGMHVRLAFAVAAHLEPEILLVDEVLAVGDAEFQKKCLGKMGEVAGGGRTVLFVSHNMAAVARLCERAMWLNASRVADIGEPDHLISEYLGSGTAGRLSGRVQWPRDEAGASSEIHLREAHIRGLQSGGYGRALPNETIEAVCIYEQLTPLRGERVVFEFLTSAGAIAFASTDHNQRQARERGPGVYRVACRIPPNLLNRGMYFLRVRIGIPGERVIIPDQEICGIVIDGVSGHGSDYDPQWPGAVCPELEWKIERLQRDVCVA